MGHGKTIFSLAVFSAMLVAVFFSYERTGHAQTTPGISLDTPSTFAQDALVADETLGISYYITDLDAIASPTINFEFLRNDIVLGPLSFGTIEEAPALHYVVTKGGITDETQLSVGWRTGRYFSGTTPVSAEPGSGYAVRVTLFDGTAEINSETSAPFSILPQGTLAGAFDLAAGTSHTCALVNQGMMTVKCWGANDRGQLGDGTVRDRTVPASVTAGFPTEPYKIAAGNAHTCVLLWDGTVRCWGDNNRGQLGNPAAITRSTVPQEVLSLSGVAEVDRITAGGDHTCALLTNGDVFCWGANDRGQLGDGTTTDQPTPVKVQGVAGVWEISAGAAHTCAVLDSGAIRCWGANDQGQLGDGTTTDQLSPVTVILYNPDILDNMYAISVSSGRRHTCGLVDADVFCWGDNANGQLGDGTTEDRLTPVAAQGPQPLFEVFAGDDHTCIASLDEPTRVFCWGANDRGQLGDGTKNTLMAPVEVGGLTDLASYASKMALGAAHSCIILDDAMVRCWGANDRGQLGDGTLNDRLTPVVVGAATASFLESNALVRIPGDPRIYVIATNWGGRWIRRHIPNPDVFAHYAFSWGAIREVDSAALSLIPAAEFLESDGKTIWRLTVDAEGDVQRIWIPTYPALQLLLGTDALASVAGVDQEEIDAYPRARLLKTSDRPEVFYLTNEGLLKHIPNAAVFASYGNRWEDVVEMSDDVIAEYGGVAFVHLDENPKVYKLENGQKRWVRTPTAFERIGGDWATIAPVNATELAAYAEGAPIE